MAKTVNLLIISFGFYLVSKFSNSWWETSNVPIWEHHLQKFKNIHLC